MTWASLLWERPWAHESEAPVPGRDSRRTEGVHRTRRLDWRPRWPWGWLRSWTGRPGAGSDPAAAGRTVVSRREPQPARQPSPAAEAEAETAEPDSPARLNPSAARGPILMPLLSSGIKENVGTVTDVFLFSSFLCFAYVSSCSFTEMLFYSENGCPYF